ncbi:uncharacterized protein MONBRDRAFT_34366 [Monosiga brevicollis MX1]|uniref:guanylate cyclase n=1 Tax=Monosiga brevicollis TaxID=81824 RepID=A9VB68_MONBE|nr:uncharacterized protein MONBRDRAFT_34366 [Monosiga brevicollis MX1]EDQ85134.1 predicted protein [Monosiga brevicollis MX1]|eukprot:XP_001749959.1 hypothetical protein [Monosiga brevicollis MX1]
MVAASQRLPALLALLLVAAPLVANALNVASLTISTAYDRKLATTMAYVAQQLNINVTITKLSVSQMHQAADQLAVNGILFDMMVVDPAVYACLSTDNDVYAIASFDMPDVAGLIVSTKPMTSANLTASAGLRVGGASPFTLGGGLAHALTLNELGFNVFQDSKQVIFSQEDSKTLRFLDDGWIDLAFISRATWQGLSPAQQTNYFLFNSQATGSLASRISTDLYPTWVLAAIGTPTDEADEVATLLLSIDPLNNPAESSLQDFRSADSFANLHMTLRRVGIVDIDETTKLEYCVPMTTPRQGLFCPSDMSLRSSEDAVDVACTNLVCPAGASCICKPCTDRDNFAVSVNGHECDRYHTCAMVRQLDHITLVLDDRNSRLVASPQVSIYVIPFNTTSADFLYNAPMTYSQSGHVHSYVIELKRAGTILIVLESGITEKVESSPVIVTVHERLCDSEFATPGLNGECLCLPPMELNGLGECAPDGQHPTPKPVYRFAYYEPSGLFCISLEATCSYKQAAITRFTPTIEYLNRIMPPRFEMPIKLQLVAMTADELHQAIEDETVDFVFTEPAQFTCYEVQHGLVPLVTMQREVPTPDGDTDIQELAGAIVVRTNEAHMYQNYSNLVGKAVAMAGFIDLAGGMAQWWQLRENGVELLTDVAQVVISRSDEASLQLLLSNQVDAAFVTDGFLQRKYDANETQRSRVSVFRPLSGLVAGHQPYPRESSTPVFPEWIVAAIHNVDADVAKEVAQILLDQMHYEDSAIVGQLEGWQPGMSYEPVREVLYHLGYIFMNTSTHDFVCPRVGDPYEDIHCPTGTYKRAASQMQADCIFRCPTGMSCYCKPCAVADAQEVSPVRVYTADGRRLTTAELEALDLHDTCTEMDVCASVEQQGYIQFQIEDHFYAKDGLVTIRATVHDTLAGDTEDTNRFSVGVHQGNGFYLINISAHYVGAQLVEIARNGVDLAQSPFLISVKRRTCLEDLREADDEGECVCSSIADDVNGTCVLKGIFQSTRTEFVIGATSITDKAGVQTLYAPRVAYLNEVGTKYAPPLTFTVDFIWVDPAIFTCFEVQYDYKPLLTLKTEHLGQGYDHFAGQIIVRANDMSITSVYNLTDKIVAAESLMVLGSGQSQWTMLMNSGFELMSSTREIIITGNEMDTITYVLQGFADAGFVRSLTLAKLDQLGDVDASLFRVLSAPLESDRPSAEYPVPVSTRLYPEWLLATAPGIDENLRNELVLALLDLEPTSLEARSGLYHSFEMAQSYSPVRDVMRDLGYIVRNNDGTYSCPDRTTTFQTIRCTDGFYRKTSAEIDTGCAQAGISCPAGKTCVCKPCRKADPVEIIPIIADTEEGEVKDIELDSASRINCERMTTCITAVQRQPIGFHVYDNLYAERGDVAVTYILHDRRSTEEADTFGDSSLASVSADIREPGHYFFQLSSAARGSHVMEVFINGEQAPNSPLILAIGERTCTATNTEADETGLCVCTSTSTSVGGSCFDTNYLIISIAVPVALLLVILITAFVRYQQKKADALWTIDRSELFFDDPPEVLGRGTFGLVLKGTYRGSAVAVKRTMPANFFAGDADSLFARSSRTSAATRTMMGSRSASANTLGSMRSDDPLKSRASNAFSKSLLNRINSDNEEDTDAKSKRTQGSMAGMGQGGLMTRMGAGILGKTFGVQRRRAAMRKEFITEMRLLSKLRHPNIVTVMGAVTEKGQEPLLILEHMEHGSLYSLLRNPQMELDAELTLPIVKDIVSGMLFLHTSREPIVHCDLKAMNVLCDSNLRAKISDFGLTAKTQCGGIGTPYWMAPELLRGEVCTTASDVYAFGVTVWETVARTDPYDGLDMIPTLREIAHPHKSKKPLRPTIPKDCSQDLSELMQSCWKENPLQRPTFEEIDTKLRSLQVRNVGMNMMQAHIDKKRQGNVLQDVFPPHIAAALAEGRRVEPEHHECVTIFFSDIVGFTDISGSLAPEKVSDMLDRLYTQFDSLCEMHDIFKVETIGDAFMCCSNLVKTQDDHAARLARFALDAIEAAAATMIDEDDPDRGTIKIRVGLHSGPVVANVVGSRNPRFCLFGDTVNVASRMESNSEKGRVHLSKPAADLVKEQDANLNLVSRGKVTIKGKGQMHTYWLLPDGVTLEEETRIKRTVSFVDEVADAVAVDMDAISVIDEASRRASEASRRASEASRRASEVPGGPGGPRRGSGYVFYSEDDYTTPTGPGSPKAPSTASSAINSATGSVSVHMGDDNFGGASNASLLTEIAGENNGTSSHV